VRSSTTRLTPVTSGGYGNARIDQGRIWATYRLYA
jgi:hypothetical protein